MTKSSFHEPVMLREAVDSLGCMPGGTYFDGTLGGGGHAYEILARTSPDGILVGVDRDSDALSEAERRLKVFKGPGVPCKREFCRHQKYIIGTGY